MRKRIAAIHDLASYGGAALLNIIPIMYSNGIEVNPIPTAIFTSHGAFKGIKKQDAGVFMDEYTSQWSELGLQFSGIYLGLFTDHSQVLSALKFIDAFDKNNPLIVLDPILGDNGKMYSFMDSSIIDGVRSLISKAHVITPNLTEACLLTNRSYNENMLEEEISAILLELSEIGTETVILTSVQKGNFLNNYIYNKRNSTTDVISFKKLPGSYPGTGDAFTALVMAEILNGGCVYEGVVKASMFIEKGIKLLLEKGYNPLEGLPLGEMLSLKGI